MDIERIKNFILRHIVTLVSILIAIISLACSATYVYLNKCEVCQDCELSFSEKEEELVKQEAPLIRVDVKGAVKKPGVYEFEMNSTVNDAILSAGGLSSGGVTTNINLSKKLSDEMVIYIFTKNELKERETKNEVVCEIPKCECEEIVSCDAIINNNQNNSNSSSNSIETISINSATLEQLMTLEGIGESKAKNIIEYRNTNGPFTKIEDIKNVSGIGESAFEKIKDRITL